MAQQDERVDSVPSMEAAHRSAVSEMQVLFKDYPHTLDPSKLTEDAELEYLKTTIEERPPYGTIPGSVPTTAAAYLMSSSAQANPIVERGKPSKKEKKEKKDKQSVARHSQTSSVWTGLLPTLARGRDHRQTASPRPPTEQTGLFATAGPHPFPLPKLSPDKTMDIE